MKLDVGENTVGTEVKEFLVRLMQENIEQAHSGDVVFSQLHLERNFVLPYA